MNNKIKDIYKGTNPIFESLSSGLNEDKMGKKSKENDYISTLSTIFNTFFSILLNSKMENLKTERGFQEVKNKIMGANSVDTLKQYLISLLGSFKSLDTAQKEAYDQNIKFISESFDSINNVLADPKMFETVKKDTIQKLVNNFENDLKDREQQMKKTNPKLFGEVVKQGLAVKEARSGEESDVEDAEFRGKVFNKSKESLDAATAFVGTIDRDKYVPTLKNNSDIERYEKIAQDLYKKAQDLQMLDRKGLRTIVTASGEIKRNDYLRQQDSLLNEIIRQKKEYQRIKDGILKSTGITPPPPVQPVCPPGKKYDQVKGICVGEGETQTKTEKKPTPTPVPATDCTFPVGLNKKCNQVGDIQSKLMELLPSVKEYLSKKGGADKVYGKGTSTVSNIVWGYISNNTGQSLTSDLTKEMYDAIMALTPNDIDATTKMVIGTAIKDSKDWEMSLGSKIQEMEEVKKSPVLFFEDFYSVLEESYSFSKIDEDSLESGIGSGVKNDPNKTSKTSIKISDQCVKDSIAQGKVLPCAKGEEKKKEEEEKLPPTREEWKGLKYVNTGTYPISFDESLLSAWGKEIAITAISFALPGSGYVAKGASTGIRGLAISGAEKVGAEKLAQRLAGEAATKTIGQRLGTSVAYPAMRSVSARLASTKSTAEVANQLSNISVGFFRKYGRIPIPKRTAAGLIGGTVGGKVLDFLSGRNAYIITVTEGYIEKSNLLGVVSGLVDTIDGYVSDDDWATIAQVMAVIKGSWTSDDGKPMSAWSFIKDRYQEKEGENLIEDISSVSAKVGEVEGFPKLKSASPLSSESEIDWDFARTELIDFIGKLESNEAKLKENLSKLPKDYIEALENGDFAEYDENGEVKGIEEKE